ncbi:MAG: AAA family ATPase [Acidaminobacter sp.]|nr:AAA family ATPase [Acidaminobacter sp.]MZQ99650.1 AAA family ATPase [Acidaminobacter sp.]
MYRTALEQLTKWHQKQDKKPLIIRGARQVGKTWLMKHFGSSSLNLEWY